MTLRPIPGAPAGAPIPPFPGSSDNSPAPATPAPQATPTTPPERVFWARRTDQIHVIRMAPRRGYFSEPMAVRVYLDGTLVVANEVELPPHHARRFINFWHSGRGEFNYTASATLSMEARWDNFGDGKRGLLILIFDRMKDMHENSKMRFGALEKEAMRCAKELMSGAPIPPFPL